MKNKLEMLPIKKDIETNSSEEKISPNCLITIKKYYKGRKSQRGKAKRRQRQG